MVPQRIDCFNKLVRLVHAGNGEFFFFNSQTQYTFNLKFTRLHGTQNQSRVNVCYTKMGKPTYMEIAKFDFASHTLYLKHEVAINTHTLQRLLQGIEFVFNHVFTGKPFKPNISVMYSGNCCRCGKLLTTSKSRVLGFGEECESHYKQEHNIFQFKTQFDLIKHLKT